MTRENFKAFSELLLMAMRALVSPVSMLGHRPGAEPLICYSLQNNAKRIRSL